MEVSVTHSSNCCSKSVHWQLVDMFALQSFLLLCFTLKLELKEDIVLGIKIKSFETRKIV